MAPPNFEYVLRTPPWAIFAMYVALIASSVLTPLPRTVDWGASVGQPNWSIVIYVFLVLLWSYALYDASRSRTQPASRDRLGYKVFIGASIAIAMFLLLSAYLYYAEHPPQGLAQLLVVLNFPTPVLLFASIGYAANAMHKAEVELGHQPEWHPLISVFFMPIGIWFIYRPIQRLLAAPRVPAP